MFSKYTRAASALSVGGVREQFSCPENIWLSQWSSHFMRNIDEYLTIDEPPCISFFDSSYLFLATSEGADILKSNAKIQQ